MIHTTLAVPVARLGLLIGLLVAPLTARAEACQGAPSAARLLVVVDAVRSDQGLMTASLYPNDRSKFLVRYGALKVWRIPAQAPQTRMCIWLKGPGTYALAIYHDANANYRLDRNLFGPTEAYGFSNNPHIAFAPPSLSVVTFQAAAGDTTIHVRLHYP